MSAAAKEFTQEQKEYLFQEILRLYDFSDKVVNTIGAPGVTNRVTQIEIATPFIQQAVASADILNSVYTDVVHGKREITADLQETTESAFRAFFAAFHELINNMEEKLMPNGGNI